jgi:hypothetical protein
LPGILNIVQWEVGHRLVTASTFFEHHMKILIIEDEINIAQVLRLYLEQAGYTLANTPI